MTAVTAALAPDLPLDVEEFLTWLAVERGRSRNTLGAYRRDLTTYCRWLDERGRPLSDVVEADVTAYVGHLRAGGRAPASVARATAAVRGLHRFLAEEGRTRPTPRPTSPHRACPPGCPSRSPRRR